ncbi:FAD-dependent oxidoreductase [Rhodoferax sp. WC2427]|uniref:FAD-dependent oxidoreductase n=1 Tax=Rhodoferax sp. WC2427 TaxID=3234144 RepID=UPI003467E0AC
MKVAVIGAGVVGVSTAYELAADGHQVTVFERHSAAAEEASFASAGLLTLGTALPSAPPGLVGSVLQGLFSRNAPVQLGWGLTGNELAWLWKCRSAQQPAVYLDHRARLHRLAGYSAERLQALTHHLHLDYDRIEGSLLLLRTAKERDQAQPGLQWLREAGVAWQQLDAPAARLHEPALNADTPLAAAIHLPGDAVGNCRQFTMLLKAEAQQLGVQFEFNRTVAHIEPAPAATVSIANEATPRRFDAVVVCAGLASAALLRPLGVQIPLAAVYGYSLSAAIREPLNAPVSAVVDGQHQISIARMGQRVRVAGGFDMGSRADAKNPAAIARLYQVLYDWFPGAAQLASNVQIWKGARPTLPDGTPVIGPSGRPGIWLNLGHGAYGWALASGSARATADLVAGRVPELDIDGWGLERLRH